MTMSKGQSVENATEWLYEHIEDADLNEQLFIVGQEGHGTIKQEQYAGDLSYEERLKIANEKIAAGKIRREEEKK